MTDQTITLKTVAELRVDPLAEAPRRFHIPAYQRGYRWSTLQVTQLLDDIRDFTQRRNPQPEHFYCLQPLVIRVRPGGVLEVVDGQQRLTTLLLILRHFNERLAARYQQPVFKLDYATRPTLDTFLAAAPTEQAALAEDNVDFFHLHQAIGVIEEWFAMHDNKVEEIKAALLNQTKVIWYELAEGDNPVDAFTRLNVGKIPLTNDELIRALFLHCNGPDEKEETGKQLRIAHEWDQIEKALQADAFWYFLSNAPQTGQNRIGFLFDLVARSYNIPAADHDAYRLFYIFNERMQTPGVTAETEWASIKRAYLMLEEWYEDRKLYHMVGFLVSQGTSISKIQGFSTDCTKSAFEQRLRDAIYTLVMRKKLPDGAGEAAIRLDIAERMGKLLYGSQGQEIRSVLLLFNLATLLQDRRSNIRFQFDSFKSQRWDIEHIRSVADDKPERHHDRRDWLKNSLGYLQLQEDDEAATLCTAIEAFCALSQVQATNEVFDPLYDRVLRYFGEETAGQAEQGIGNLTLLDDHTNRSYSNAVFAVKRQRMLNLDQAGIFVPLCTRNVFLKCYSPQVDNAMFWSEDDQQGYAAAITSTLVNFFCGKQEGIQ